MDLTQLRERVCNANKMLLATGLVTMHSGNASGLDRQSGRLVIKPSGVDYETLKPEDLVEVDLASGELINSRLRPSVDLPHHLYLYRHMAGVCGIIHTHSNYATAWAAVGKPIPLCLTAIADQFGAEIPCTPYVDNDEDHIGRTVLKHRNRAPAILLGNHGVITWGESVEKAFYQLEQIEFYARITLGVLQQDRPPRLLNEEQLRGLRQIGENLKKV